MDTSLSQTAKSQQLPSNNVSKRRQRRLKSLLAIVLVALLVGLGLFYHSYVYDYVYANYVYHPASQVKVLADDLGLTERGTDIFYASQPLLSDSSQSFPCSSGEDNAVILGCFEAGSAFLSPGLIYVLDVQNPSLKGVVAVTAAHEILHAAYARLNVFERQKVDTMIEVEYNKIKDDPVIKDQMAYYQISEPGQNLNELHSIIGTTVVDIDPALESYYGRYFKDREILVTDYQNYYQALHKNDAQVKGLEAELKTASTELAADIDAYSSDLKQLNADIEAFNSRANSGTMSNRTFTAEKNALVARIDDMNARASGINTRVVAYNDNINLLNSLSAETQSLYSSLKGVATTKASGV
ncbi:MAG: hypothetical protein ABI397_03330 [Candidatus Saccharimonas sp.]